MSERRPLRIAILNDYEIVVRGLARMLEDYAERVQVVEVAANRTPDQGCDIALYDTFSQGGSLSPSIAEVLADSQARALVVYSWALEPRLVKVALDGGASGYLGKGISAADLVAALERVASGETVVTEQTPATPAESGDWPGRHLGLTIRESEIIALITQGLSNQQIAERAFLSINSVKSYIRSSYRKMAVSSRSQAVLWGIENGFRPDQVSVRRPSDEL